MLLERRDGGMIDLDAGKARLEAAFLMVMRGAAENDGYNALTLAGGLGLARRGADPHAVALPAPGPRALFAGLHVGDAGQARAASPAISSNCSTPASIRAPRPRKTRDAKQKAIAARIEEELQKVESLDEDRILRHFVNAVQSAIRTNFFQTDKDGQLKALIAVKFESGKITDLPLPRPLYEIFVYSPRVEGVHMRFGKVARGGIRWSDRPQDFRTEILGLVKAQQVKNAVIVPVGAKGGFVPKLMPKGADARTGAGGRHRHLQAVHLDAARHHRQHPSRRQRSFRPTAWCATRATIPIWWWPPTRAPPPSPTSPTRFRSSTTTGWATPSPPAARPATTTRPWASPRAAPGRR